MIREPQLANKNANNRVGISASKTAISRGMFSYSPWQQKQSPHPIVRYVKSAT
jgi:hypothetical protein